MLQCYSGRLSGSSLANPLLLSRYPRSEEKQRISGREQLHALGFPCWGPGAATARVELRLNKLFSFASHGEEDTKEGLCIHR